MNYLTDLVRNSPSDWLQKLAFQLEGFGQINAGYIHTYLTSRSRFSPGNSKGTPSASIMSGEAVLRMALAITAGGGAVSPLGKRSFHLRINVQGG